MVSPSLAVTDTKMSDIFFVVFEYIFGVCDMLPLDENKFSTLG